MAFDADDTNPRMLVAIDNVDPVTGNSRGYNANVGHVIIYPRIYPGGLRSIPAAGEQWVVQKMSGSWFLDDKADWQDPKATLPFEEGLTAVGGTGPTYVLGSSVELPSETYIGGVRYASGGGGSTPSGRVDLDLEMVINGGTLVSGYNDLAGGVLVNAPAGFSLEQIVFRLGGDPTATIGGSGGVTARFYRGTPTAAEVTQVGALTNMTAHDTVLTLTTPFTVTHNSVLRCKIEIGSAIVTAPVHIQWRGRRL